MNDMREDYELGTDTDGYGSGYAGDFDLWNRSNMYMIMEPGVNVKKRHGDVVIQRIFPRLYVSVIVCVLS